MVCVIKNIEQMAAENSELAPVLEAEFSVLDDEYFGERIEEREPGSSDESVSENESLSEEDDGGTASMMKPRELDVEEVQAIQCFISDTCGCSKKQGAPCSGYFDEEKLAETRMSMAELENDQLDLVILSQINAHHFSGKLFGHRNKEQKARRAKEYTNFFYMGRNICQKMFLFIHGIGMKRFRNLMKHYQLNGVTTRTHGNVRRLPWNASTVGDKERAIKFIENFAEVNALPLPGRMPKFYDYNVMLLPTSSSKASVYRDYVTASQVLQESSVPTIRVFGYREFCRLWLEVVPYIRVMPPADDLCLVCQNNTTKIMQSANLSEDEKKARLIQHQEHLDTAKKQRQYYREKVASSKSVLKSNQGDKSSVTLSYSFDHAQQVHYPSHPQKPGPLYFKTPRKCAIFGVCDEGTNSQVNFLIDEAQSCGKGANSIVSMVHYYLMHFSHGEENVCLHADNCIGQNKNNVMTSYLAWRVAVGLSKSCELSFMLPGHTRFSPDRFFGLIKRKYKHSDVSSLIELARIVEESTQGGQNEAFVIGSEDPTKLFQYYDWAEFLSTYFTSIPHITSYYNFHFSQNKVVVREFADTEEEVITILRPGVTIDKSALPSTLSPSGLSEQRKQYLYKEIRGFCEEKYKDITCPEPSRKRPVHPEPAITGPSHKRLCSYCRNPGHTKTRKGEITCPKLLSEHEN